MKRTLLHVVGGGGNAAAVSGPVRVEEFAPRLVDAFIGVRAEVVTLCLQKVGRESSSAIAIEKRESSGKRRRGNSEQSRIGDSVAPRVLILIEYARKKAVEQKIAEGGVGCKSVF